MSPLVFTHDTRKHLTLPKTYHFLNHYIKTQKPSPAHPSSTVPDLTFTQSGQFQFDLPGFENVAMANNQKNKMLRLTDGTAEQNLKAPKVPPVKYQKVRILREGYKGIIELMKRLDNGRLAVFKTYKKQNFDEVDGIVMEAYILKTVLPSHPQIIHCYNYSFPANKPLKMVFDYYEGGDLGELIRSARDPLPESLLWDIFIQMAGALAHLHHGHSSKSVVHAAVEPSNIFCGQKYELGGKLPSLVLGDFSMAFVGDSRRGGGELSIFQPPEFPSISAKTDVWGLGATIHALAHKGETSLTITDAARKEIPSANQSKEWTKAIKKWLSKTRFPKGYSDELKGCMGRCLELDKEERTDSKDLVEMLSKERGVYEANLKKPPKK